MLSLSLYIYIYVCMSLSLSIYIYVYIYIYVCMYVLYPIHEAVGQEVELLQEADDLENKSYNIHPVPIIRGPRSTVRMALLRTSTMIGYHRTS